MAEHDESDLSNEELDLLRMFDGPPNLSAWDRENQLQALAIRAVREIRRRRELEETPARVVVIYDDRGHELARAVWRGEMDLEFTPIIDGTPAMWELENGRSGPRRGAAIDPADLFLGPFRGGQIAATDVFMMRGDTMRLRGFGRGIPRPSLVRVPINSKR